MKRDSLFRQRAYLYDANNRQKRSSNLDGTDAVRSVYDGAGQRVATMAGGAITNVMVYDAFGQLAAEYAPGASAGGGTRYVAADHQGSPRVVMNTTGADGWVVSRRDYLPFGEDVPGSVGMRAQTFGYWQPGGVRQGYAGMEGDDETGMGHTLWREYDSLSARWTAPDPYGGSMTLADPQSFNRYSYCDNDPVNRVDPLGLMLSDIGVVQTSDPEYARTLQGASDASWMKGINQQYAERHGLAVVRAQEQDGAGYHYTAVDPTLVPLLKEVEGNRYETSVNVLEEDVAQSQTETQLGIVGGPLMATQPENELRELNNTPCVGKECDCVPLVKKLTGTENVSAKGRWREGEHALDLPDLQPGTAIATFFNGRYPSLPSGNHAAIFLRHVSPSKEYPLGGIEVLDQYARKGKVSIRVIPTLKHDGDVPNNARRFSVIYITPPPAQKRR